MLENVFTLFVLCVLGAVVAAVAIAWFVSTFLEE